MSAPQPTLQKVTLSNPEDDEDLDDLDDVIDQFNKPKSDSVLSQIQTQSSGAASASFFPESPTATRAPPPQSGLRPRTNTRVDARPISVPGSAPNILKNLTSTTEEPEVDEEALGEEFAKELAKGMESLIMEMARGSSGGDSIPAAAPQLSADGQPLSSAEMESKFRAAWESILLGGMNEEETGGQAVPGASSNTGATGPAPPTSSSFRDTIRQTAEKLKASESNLKGEQAGGESDPLKDLLASLSDLGISGEDAGEGGDDAEIAGFLETMMSQLMGKDVLYEPLKELVQNFGPYLASPPQPISAEDRTRYESQVECSKRILAVFERPGYKDEDPDTAKEIMDLMSELQTLGSPPTEVTGDLPPGLAGLDGAPENCTIM